MVIETIGEPNDDGFEDDGPLAFCKECFEPFEDCACGLKSDDLPCPSCSFCGGSGEVEEVCSETGKRNCPECNGETQ